MMIKSLSEAVSWGLVSPIECRMGYSERSIDRRRVVVDQCLFSFVFIRWS